MRKIYDEYNQSTKARNALAAALNALRFYEVNRKGDFGSIDFYVLKLQEEANKPPLVLLPTEVTVAAKFIEGVRGCLTYADLQLVNARNKANEYTEACALQDVCDGNELMGCALADLGVKALGPGNDPEFAEMAAEFQELWNTAWKLAQVAGFDVNNLPKAEQEIKPHEGTDPRPHAA